MKNDESVDRKQGTYSVVNARSFSDKECAVILLMAYEYVVDVKNKSGDNCEKST